MRRIVPLAVGGASVGLAGYIAPFEDRREAFLSSTDGWVRFFRATYHGAIVAADYKYSLYGLEDKKSDEYKKVQREVHARAAERLLNICRLHGGLFTKVGQYIASMNHVLPKEYTSTLAALQDQVRPREFDAIRRVLESEFGVPLETLFAQFDREPIASASLAQVHRATGLDGKPLAVKVQYPRLREEVEADMWTFRVLMSWVGRLFPDFEFSWMLPEFEESLRWELDFGQEARNARRVSAMFADTKHVRVTESIPELSSSRVLTMEFVDGIKVNNVAALTAAGVDPHEVASAVSTCFGDMIFYHGFVHCDPHPGNMLVVPLGRSGAFDLVVLDHGMYRRLSPEFRRTYCRMWKALILRDQKLLKDAASDLGVGRSADVLSLIFTYRSSTAKSTTGSGMTAEERAEVIAKLKGVDMGDINRFMESLPRDMLFVMRCTNLVRSLNMELGGTSRERFRIMGECAMRGLALDQAELTEAVAAQLIEDRDIADDADDRFRRALKSSAISEISSDDSDTSRGPLRSIWRHRAVNQPVESELARDAQQPSLFRLAWWWHVMDVSRLRFRMWVIERILDWFSPPPEHARGNPG